MFWEGPFVCDVALADGAAQARHDTLGKIRRRDSAEYAFRCRPYRLVACGIGRTGKAWYFRKEKCIMMQ